VTGGNFDRKVMARTGSGIINLLSSRQIKRARSLSIVRVELQSPGTKSLLTVIVSV